MRLRRFRPAEANIKAVKGPSGESNFVNRVFMLPLCITI